MLQPFTSKHIYQIKSRPKMLKPFLFVDTQSGLQIYLTGDRITQESFSNIKNDNQMLHKFGSNC